MLRKEYNVFIYDPKDPEKVVKHFNRCKGRKEVIDFINDCFGGATIVTKTTLQTKLHNPQKKKINKTLENCVEIKPIEPYEKPLLFYEEINNDLEPIIAPHDVIAP